MPSVTNNLSETTSDNVEPHTGYKLCKRGHVRSPENVYSTGHCKECLKAYNKSEKYKEYQKAYHQLEENKKIAQMRWGSGARNEYMRLYRYTEARKAYEQSEKYKERVKKSIKKYREQLTRTVIAQSLHLSVSQLSEELYEIKKLTIQLGRSLKCQSNQNL